MVLDGVCLGVGIGFDGVLESGGAGSWLLSGSSSSGSVSASLAASMAVMFRVSVMLSKA